jgi:hypothetical protein
MTDVVTVAIVAAIPATLAAILGLFNRNKLGKVETRMDGRLDELLEITRISSFAAGKKEQKTETEANGAS